MHIHHEDLYIKYYIHQNNDLVRLVKADQFVQDIGSLFAEATWCPKPYNLIKGTDEHR